MQLRSLRPKRHIPDVETTPKVRKPDTEVIIKHGDLYARVWESVFANLIFDNDPDDPSPPNSREMTLETKPVKTETCSTPGNARESSTEIFPPTKWSCGGMDMYPMRTIEPDAEKISETPVLLLPSSAKPNTLYATIRSLIATMTTDNKLSICVSVFHGTHTYTFHKSQERVLEPIRGNSNISSSLFVVTLWWPTHFLLNPPYFKKRRLLLNSSLYTGRIQSILHIFFRSANTIHTKKQIQKIGVWQKVSQIARGQFQTTVIPLGKLVQLFGFPTSTWLSRRLLTVQCCTEVWILEYRFLRGVSRGLTILKRLGSLTGLRFTFLFFDILEEASRLLCLGVLTEGFTDGHVLNSPLFHYWGYPHPWP